MRKLALTIVVVVAFGLSFQSCKKDEPFVVKVGREKITENALKDKLSVMPADFRKFAATPVGRRHFLDIVIQQSVVVEVAKKAGIERRAEFKKALENFKNEQQKQLADYKNGLLVGICLKEIREKVKVSDSELQNYYNEHKSVFERPIAYTVRHILVSDKETAQNVHEKLKNGAKFEQVAREFSEDTATSQNGGLLGPVKQGSLASEFEAAVLKLGKNEMSEILETHYGYHIILKMDEQNLPAQSFNEAKETIKKIMEKNKFDAWFNKEKENLDIKVNYEISVSEDKQQK